MGKGLGVEWEDEREDKEGLTRPGFRGFCGRISKMDACYVGEKRVQAQEGDFYGGWITSGIVGPFKGGPGTGGVVRQQGVEV